MHINKKAAKIWQLAFSITFVSLLVACEDPGSIGSDFIEKSELKIDTLYLSSFAEQALDPYLGRLSRSSIGNFSDPLFGDFETISFFKPPISRPDDSFEVDRNNPLLLKLRLHDEVVYGDTSTVNSYSIYRINNLWRGSNFRKSESINYGSELIGSFTDNSFDSSGFANVTLDGSWKQDYINYYNLGDSVREQTYRNNEFGLAIVPNANSEKIIHTNFSLSSFIIVDADTSIYPILDWATDIERTVAISDPDRIILQNAPDNYLTINFSEVADNIESKNFVRADLVFNVDTTAINNSIGNSLRASNLGLGLIVGPSDDIAYELGFGGVDIASAINDGEYRLNITTLLNNYLYAGASIEEVYLYLVATEGVLTHTSLFSTNTGLGNAPRVIVYGIEEEK